MTAAKTALIIGASRGLGLGLVKRLHEDGWQVTATVRDPQKAENLRALSGVQIKALDMNDRQQLDRLGRDLQGQVFDLLFVNAGIKGPAEQNAEVAREQDIGELFLTNAIAPIRLAQRFAAQIRSNTGVIAFMSSILGSVTMPDAPELALYKASKAALNSMTNSFVTQLADPTLTVLAMHPGWVKTDMGGEGADLDIETSTAGLVEQVKAYAGKGGLWFINYKGDNLIW
ncbi:3-oxoacyl-[acyl-carrier-protein] reductase [compost metagenome]